MYKYTPVMLMYGINDKKMRPAQPMDLQIMRTTQNLNSYKMIQLCLSPLLLRLGTIGSESALCVRLARFGVPDPLPSL